MDFRHVRDEKTHFTYQKWFNEQTPNDQNAIRVEMRLFLATYGPDREPRQAEKPLKVKRRRPHRK